MTKTLFIPVLGFTQAGRAKAAKQRKAKLEAGASVEEEVVWIPKGSPALKIRKPVRSLLEMTAGMLCDHVEAIESLVGASDMWTYGVGRMAKHTTV